MMGRMDRLGGWWRLWIVTSGLWIVAAVVVSDWYQPDSKVVKIWAQSNPSIGEVNSARKTLCTTEQLAILSDFKGPTRDLVMPTLAISHLDKRKYDVVLHCHERLGFAHRMRDNLVAVLALPLGLLLFGLAISWVRIGFKKDAH